MVGYILATAQYQSIQSAVNCEEVTQYKTTSAVGAIRQLLYQGQTMAPVWSVEYNNK